MKLLETIAVNPFLIGLEEASRENTVQFVKDTINRIDTHDTAKIYAADNTLLKGEFGKYEAAVLSTELGDQKSSTDNLNLVRADVTTFGDDLFVAVQNSFGTKSTKLTEFFPRGKAFVRKAKRGQVSTIISVWSGKINEYDKALDAKWKTNVATLATRWQDVLKAQSLEKSNVAEGRENTEASITPMAKILWRIFRKVIDNNEDDAVNAVKIYFDEAPLRRKQSADSDGLGRVSGLVTDKGGNALYNVDILVLDTKGKQIWNGQTGKDGKYRTPNLPIGYFTFSFIKTGFATQSPAHEILDYEDTILDVIMN